MDVLPATIQAARRPVSSGFGKGAAIFYRPVGTERNPAQRRADSLNITVELDHGFKVVRSPRLAITSKRNRPAHPAGRAAASIQYGGLKESFGGIRAVLLQIAAPPPTGENRCLVVRPGDQRIDVTGFTNGVALQT